MSSLIEIQNQIEKLQKQANDIKAREFDKTVQEIRNNMQAFGIILKDLQPGKVRKSTGKQSQVGSFIKGTGGRVNKKNSSTVAAKYRGPNDEVWSGRGLTPRWLVALVAQGRKKEDFVIKN